MADLLRGEECKDSLRPPQIERFRIGRRPRGEQRIIGNSDAGRQDRWIVVEIAARTVSFGFGLLHDQCSGIHALSVRWPGFRGVIRRIARLRERHHETPCQGTVRETADKVMPEKIWSHGG